MSGDSPRPDTAFFTTPRKSVRPSRTRRNPGLFKLGGSPPERGRAGSAGGIADDHGVDAAVLDLGNRRIGADDVLALRKGVERQHLGVREIRLQHGFQQRKRAVRLPLLAAQQADALAVEAALTRGVTMGDFQLPGGIEELQLNHGSPHWIADGWSAALSSMIRPIGFLYCRFMGQGMPKLAPNTLWRKPSALEIGRQQPRRERAAGTLLPGLDLCSRYSSLSVRAQHVAGNGSAHVSP